MATIFTIGFTKKSLRDFVETLRRAGVKRVIDVRLRNTSQLAGWSKHHPEFAPTDELLDAYKKDHDWTRYEERFNQLLAERRPEAEARELLELLRKDSICLLCTEPQADKCHRRLVANYLQSLASEIEVKHL
jgi:uncharacterized protein YeaO (DUF488 family)